MVHSRKGYADRTNNILFISSLSSAFSLLMHCVRHITVSVGRLRALPVLLLACCTNVAECIIVVS